MSGRAPACRVTIGGAAALGRGPGASVRIRVDRDMDVPADAVELRLGAGDDVHPGDPVDVQLGYDGSTQAVFTGVVRRVRADLQGVRVEGVGGLAPLLDLRVAATYLDVLPGAVVTDLAGRVGMAVGAAGTGPVLPCFVVDERTSGYAHLRRLAERLGLELYARLDGLLHCDQPSPVAGLPGQVTLARGRDLLAAASLAQAPAWGSVSVGGESPASTRGDRAAHWLSSDASAPDASAGGTEPARRVGDGAARTQDLARRFADGLLEFGGRRTREVAAEVPGTPGLDLGDAVAVRVSETGPALTGYVRGLRHTWDGTTGFRTRVVARLGERP